MFKIHRTISAMALAIGLSLPFCLCAHAQQLVIVPADVDIDTLVEQGYAQVDDAVWTSDTVTFRCYEVWPGQSPLDVTELTSWRSADEEIAAFADPDSGKLTILQRRGVYIFATFAGLESAGFAVDTEGDFARASAELCLPMFMDDPPASPSDIRNGIQQGLDGLTVGGVPSSQMQTALDRVRLADNASIWNLFGRSWLQDGQEALWIPQGLVANGITRFLYTSNPLIAIQSSYAQLLAQGGALDGQGRPTLAFQTVFHELLHELIDGLKKQGLFELAAEIEELFAHELASRLLPNAADAARILNQPTIGLQDQIRLRNHVSNVRATITELKAQHPNDAAALDIILEALGWQDADNNGIPDFLDELLRRRGITDPDLLPSGPNDPPLDITPLEGEGE